jgi:hypothetical protein
MEIPISTHCFFRGNDKILRLHVGATFGVETDGQRAWLLSHCCLVPWQIAIPPAATAIAANQMGMLLTSVSCPSCNKLVTSQRSHTSSPFSKIHRLVSEHLLFLLNQ